MAAQARSPYSYEEIDTDALPLPQRVALWHEPGRLPMQADPIDEEGRRRFRIQLRRLSGPSARFADLTATPMKLSRTRGHCHRDGMDMVSLTLMLEHGIEHQFSPDRPSTVIQPGHILVKDFTEAATAWWSTFHRGLNLHLPRPTVDAALGNKNWHIHGIVLSPDSLSPMLKAQMQVLAEIMPQMSPAARAAALEATVALATTVLRVAFGSRLDDERNGPGLFAAGQVFIDQHLCSRHLSPEMIARHLGCSRAHLYRVFAAHGATVADYVRESRLRRAYALLAAGNDERIGDIAFRSGFDDPVHFARLFRCRFGVTPREVRGRKVSPMAESNDT
jgi:AraC family transcriptional regulator, positive regulator of tynA and feaB